MLSFLFIPSGGSFTMMDRGVQLRPGGGGALAILCVPRMCRPQGYVFHNFCLEGCCFQAQQSGKGCV